MRHVRSLVLATLGTLSTVLSAGPALAQTEQAKGSTSPDDTPSIKVGATVYADYTYTREPRATDGDGNAIHANAFNVGRSYVNITGNVSHMVAFRITPDVTRESGSGSSLNGSLVFRIKYAFAQVNLDDWMAAGSWARIGIQQTPWLDYAEGIYRYRFQGTMFVEREGYFASADAGASFHYNLPAGWGDVHAGLFNGENYNKAEVNDQKAFMVRAAVRPIAHGSPVMRGFRAAVFYDHDHYMKSAPRRRIIGNVTFEHQYVNTGFEYLDTRDQTSIQLPAVEGRGYSVWATPRSSSGWEALLRYDRIKPNAANHSEVRSRTILGVAYWFPHQGAVSSALLLDYDGQTSHGFAPAQPRQRRIAVHALVNF